MKFALKCAFLALVLGIFVQAGAAVAGPVEDGVAAYNKSNFTTALRLLRPAAEKGDSDAQYIMGMMYAGGKGVSANPATAHMWFSLAAAKGDPDAKEQRDAVAAGMTPEQAATAAQMLTEFKPTP